MLSVLLDAVRWLDREASAVSQLRRLLLVVLLGGLWSAPSVAEPDVEVRGLYQGGAVLLIDGVQRVLRQGQTSPEGVRLRAADARQAVLDIGGERYTLGLSRRIATRFVEPAVRRAAVYRNDNNQYIAAGAINGHSVDLLVDTGANIVAMSASTARALGIDFLKESARGVARTASGLVTTYRVQLDSVTVGDITVHNVRASVNEGDYPTIVLLGMSFLREVAMRDSAGVLYLEQS